MRLTINKIKASNRLITAMLAVMMLTAALPAQARDNGPKMTKQERVCLRNGNKLYEKKRYAEAEVEYRKALQANPASEKAMFNLATALMRQGSVTASQDDKNNPMNQAEELLTHLAKGAQDKHLRGKAFYDLGNIAYGRQDYGKAIELYKHALRCNPDDDQARRNLRLAQLKKQDQDKNKKNQDQNQNQDNKDNKDNKDQNQDQDKSKDQQDKDKDKDQQNQNNQNQDQGQNQQQQQQQQQQGGMSQQNAEQVLKAMQDRERSTQQRINAQQAQQQRHERQRTNRKW